ncbi:MAG TPA: CBS domain-containing protein [Polyangia bacterium]
MRVAELILARPHHLLTGQTVEQAAKLMTTFGLTLLPVCQSEGAIVGVITARQIVNAVALGKAPNLCAVDDVMATDFPTCRGDDEVNEVYTRMVSHGLDELIVESRLGHLVGLVDRIRLAAVTGPVRPVRRLRKPA